jgi:hypothetical protein
MMFETHLILIGLWTVAGLAWVLHRYGMERTANVMMFGVVLGLSGLAEWNHWRSMAPESVEIAHALAVSSSSVKENSRRQPSMTIGQLLAADRPPPTVDSEPSTVNGFVASTIKTKYHAADCFYVRMMKHDRTFATPEEAEAAGFEPCRECAIRLALASQPLKQNPADEAKNEQDAADDSGSHSAALP